MFTNPDDPDGHAPTHKMIGVVLANEHIANIAATTYWGPDGKPMSAKDFIECMLGELSELFKNTGELFKLWTTPIRTTY